MAQKPKNLDPFETRLRKTGSAAGVTIPAEFLRNLGYEIGDTLRVTVEDQALRIQKIDQEFDTYLDLYSHIEDRFTPAFSKMVKGI
ncbi:MAG: AbrB/MazE/SpoVT family DNA-binding domain-containing protein [Sneathiella sp.]|nr:AbrB/MazE/SpoVT family DNA-binding domain-containing protein [Sneathiella sp.]